MSKRKTTLEFIEESIKIHDDKYDYSKVEYFNSSTKVEIICKKHGVFSQRPNDHLSGQCCPKCIGNHKKDTKSFINDSVNIHGDKYDYSDVEYINARTKVKIICPIHGKFWQRPNGHLSGQGCLKCTKVNGTYSHSIWGKIGSNSKNFDSFKVYIIECWNDEERFYKIGKTFQSVGKRFEKTTIPYNWKTVKVFEGSAKYISELENELHMKYKKHKYIPMKKFGGCTECFDTSISL